MVRDRFGFIERKMLLKAISIVLLVFAIVVLQVLSNGLRAKNTKIIKFIKNEDKYVENHKRLQERQKKWGRYYLKIEENADLDGMKSRYMNDILNLLQTNKLKADSYDSELKKQDGFVFFYYTITAFGNYADIIRFFLNIQNRFRYMYVKQYKMNRTGSKLIRLDLRLDILGK